VVLGDGVEEEVRRGVVEKETTDSSYAQGWSATEPENSGELIARRARSERRKRTRAKSGGKRTASYTWGPHAGRVSARETGPRSGAHKSAHPRARVGLTARARLSAPTTAVWAARGEWESGPNAGESSPGGNLTSLFFFFIYFSFPSSIPKSNLNFEFEFKLVLNLVSIHVVEFRIPTL
jgi:hypothetical protein